jgi:hypothetical protein
MSSRSGTTAHGPFRADQVRSGDPYELSQGHPIYCAPTGLDGTGPNGLGFAVLDSDPAVKRAGVDTGLKLADGTLRAPDVTVNFDAGEGTWATGALLALEYAGRGQDEDELREKIRELLAGGTRQVWVVRLVGPRRVEVHEPGVVMRVVNIDGTLTAPGVLALPVPVRALFERDAAHEVTLRNLLAAKGYASLEALRVDERAKGRAEGREDAFQELLQATIEARGWTFGAEHASRVAACHDAATLKRWTTRAVTAARIEDVFDEVDGARG